ncbi:hypothetical protein ACP275_08G032100 [Erythranthe tilingii]
MDKMDVNMEVSDKLRDEKNDLETGLSIQTLPGSPKIDAGSTENLSEVKPARKKINKRKKKKMKATVNNEIQSMDQSKTEPTESPAEGNVNLKRKRWRKRIRRSVKKGKQIQSTDQEDGMLDLHLSDGQGIEGKLAANECTDQETAPCARNELSLSESVHLCKDGETNLSPDMVVVSTNEVPFELVEDSQHSSNPNQITVENAISENELNEVNEAMIVDRGKCSTESRSCDVEMTTALSSPEMKEAECLSEDLGQDPIIAPIASVKRKLIVLDVNGLLANIVMPAPKDIRGDTHILGRAIFKRPFCDDFLKFCFQNFDVGVWSSRSKRIIDRVVDYLLGDLRDQLLFCWDMDHSTQTGFKTLENIHKPLVCKELRRIWENDDSDVRWKKGDYDESNTLLLDDSPYKALLNPLHTAIFPNSYNYVDKDDNSLGPGGDLRVYLEGLLNSEHVQKYVEQHPFGQSAINDTNLSWDFYSGVLQAISNQPQDNTPNSVPTSN